MTNTTEIAANTLLTVSERGHGAHVTITYRGEVAFERFYEDHEIVEAAVIAQDDAAEILAALAKAERSLKTHGRLLAKELDDSAIVLAGARRRDNMTRAAEQAGLPYVVCSIVCDTAHTMTMARTLAAIEERAEARKARLEADKARDRAAWDARYGTLDAATRGFMAEMGHLPRRP